MRTRTFLVAVAITLGVYGSVGLIVKMDDVGLHLRLGDAQDGAESFPARGAAADEQGASQSSAGDVQHLSAGQLSLQQGRYEL